MSHRQRKVKPPCVSKWNTSFWHCWIRFVYFNLTQWLKPVNMFQIASDDPSPPHVIGCCVFDSCFHHTSSLICLQHHTDGREQALAEASKSSECQSSESVVNKQALHQARSPMKAEQPWPVPRWHLGERWRQEHNQTQMNALPLCLCVADHRLVDLEWNTN